MADSSTTTSPILDLIAGDRWARCPLRRGIKDISVASELMKSLTLVGVVFIGILAIPELNGRFLHDQCSDPRSDCRRSLGSTPAIQWYKVSLCRIKIQEVAVFCGGYIRYQAGNILLNSRLLHNSRMDFDSVCRRLLGSPPATQWNKIYLSVTFIHDLTGSQLGGGLRSLWPEEGLELERVFCQKAAYEYRCFYVDEPVYY